ncbi:MAG: lysophospholipid acyltransferase family protein [Alphaproteobacteria bacterium]|nr:lysophospholipid acyltransferase family protein [Alphaproteobacteria bacterium]
MMLKLFFWLRAFIFTIVLYALVLSWTILCLPAFLLPVKKREFVPVGMAVIGQVLMRLIGIKIKVEGLENLPKEGGYILASKHQSALESFIFHKSVNKIIYVLKRELTWIPVVGWWFRGTNCIVINRAGAGKAMKQMFEETKKRMEQGYHLVIFPEGTRTPVGKRIPFSPGIALLYEKLDTPVIPVALNTGYCWPKNKLIKYPGTVTVRFLPAMEKGMERRAFLKALEETVNDAVDTLPKPNTYFDK